MLFAFKRINLTFKSHYIINRTNTARTKYYISMGKTSEVSQCLQGGHAEIGLNFGWEDGCIF